MPLGALPTTLPAAAREFASRASPRILASLFGLCVAGRIALSDFGLPDAGAALVLVALWPIQEWLIHVFILHYQPLSLFGRHWDFEVPRRHRAHHREPWRLELVFIPLQVYVYVPLLLAGLALALAPSFPQVLTFLSVYFLLALHYEWVHFLVHTRYRPRSRWYRRLWRNHRLHHFKNEAYWFGVTMLSGDRLLGTAPDRDKVPTSPTALFLGPQAEPPS